jgi:Dolichyl-phosphate-mannose-protein mannosyltransferase
MRLFWIPIVVLFQVALFSWPKLEGFWELNAFLASIILLILVPAFREHAQLKRALCEIFTLKLFLIFVLFVAVLFTGAVTILWPTYVVIGDELGFYTLAHALANSSRTFTTLAEIGVYGTHPLGWSLYQSLFLRIYEDSFWACRLSSMIWHYLAVFPIFLLVQLQWDTRAAWISAIVFCANYYGFQFSHFAYNNLAYLTPLMFSLMFVQLGVKKRSEVSLLLAGVTSTIGFYFNYMAFLSPVLVIASLILTLLDRSPVPPAFKINRALLLVIGGVVVGVVPFLTEFPTHVSAALRHLNISEHPAPGQLKFSFISPFMIRFQNFLMTLEAPFFFNASSHHVRGRIFDLLSTLLAAVGMLGLLLRVIRGRTAGAFYLIMTLIFCYTFGFLIPYNRPSITRLMFWIPTIAILAGVGSCFILAKFRLVAANCIVVIVLMLIVALNAKQLLDYKDQARAEHTLLKDLIILLQPTENRYIFLSNQNPKNNVIHWVETAYGLKGRLLPVNSDVSAEDVATKLKTSGAQGIIILPSEDGGSGRINKELLSQFPGSAIISVPSEGNPTFLLIK